MRAAHGDETEAWGDAGYQGVDKRPENRGCDVAWQVAMKPGKRRLLDRDGAEAAAEKRKASVRAKVEHPFLYVKRRFGSVRCATGDWRRTRSASRCCSGSRICSSLAATRDARGLTRPEPGGPTRACPAPRARDLLHFQRLSPPSTRTPCPVTYWASAERRNATTPAISSTDPGRPAGMLSTNASDHSQLLR